MKIKLNNTTKVIIMTIWFVLNGIGLYFKLLTIAEFSIVTTLIIMWLFGTQIKKGTATVVEFAPIDEMLKGKKFKWERVGDKRSKVERASIPQGWLVRTLEPVPREIEGQLEYGWDYRVAITFVPDPDHIGW